MEIRGKLICTQEAVRIRDAMRSFLAIETISFVDGDLKYTPKALSAAFFAKELGLTRTEGELLFANLIAGGYIEEGKLTPTPLGMALANAEDRDRLPLSDAHGILKEFLVAVREVNARPEARVLIQRVHVFGSYLAGADTVGDIDLLIEAPLPADCEPEDLDERAIVMGQIKISDYLSFHDELDAVATEAEKRIVYDRAKSP